MFLSECFGPKLYLMGLVQISPFDKFQIIRVGSGVFDPTQNDYPYLLPLPIVCFSNQQKKIMARVFVSIPMQPRQTVFSASQPLIPAPANNFLDGCGGGVGGAGGLCLIRRIRGCSVVARAGPSTSSYVLAFAIPATLIAATVFTSIKIADKLDEDFLEDVRSPFVSNKICVFFSISSGFILLWWLL